ncbi:trihelix transcription factor PTL-like [Populus nigra]|uniref:trihelix transcription factor PTL-like n=1 Tax=Populus nigra TaxID=3691 RepID=UPI002B27435D|nr:trihelix transcription factor PTL-like [Populus nigra]
MSEHHHQYGLPDLRQLVAGRAHFQGTQQGNEPFFVQSRNLVPQTHHFESIMVGHEAMLPSGLVKLGGRHHDHYCTNATNIITNNTITSATIGTSSSAGAGTLYGVEMENATAAGWIGNDGGNNSRWPRQETLTLLEIRSRLDSRFKEANQKGPLWDEVSRIMAEEHGYQRSGKKCREKFENLYKYYKKTKEGKAGRQDGKHYRFFRQLEALYGEPSNQAPASETHFANNTLLYQTPLSNTINQESQETFQENKHSESLSFSNTSEFETSSSENNDDDLSAIAYNMMNRSTEKQKGVNESQSLAGPKKSWRTKVEDFVDSQMRKLMEKQDAWMEKMLKTIEDREYERMCREEEWTKQELARFDREHEFWAKERAWIESRDTALMEALKKHAEKGSGLSSSVEHIAVATQRHNNNQDSTSAKKIQKDKFNNIIWTEPEILSFIQLRTSMESRFQESGYSNEGLWEEIAEEMASLGYDRSVDECKEKWESMNIYLNMTTESNKKRKDQDLRTNDYFQLLESYNGMNSSPSNSYLGTQVNDNSCFQVQINEGDQQQHLWNTNKFDLKLNKEKNQQVWHK